MKCPRCKSKVDKIKAEDGLLIRFCTAPRCEWQDPVVIEDIAHNTTIATMREERRVNGTTGEQR